MLDFYRFSQDKLFYVFLFGLILSISFIPTSLAAIPTGPIEITIENVTINNPEQSSTDKSEDSKFWGELLSQLVIAIGVTVSGTIAAILSYFFARRAPSTLEQEKLFNEIMKKAYYESYLPIWRKIWEIINSQEDEDKEEKFIEYLWKHYFIKRHIPTLEGLEQISDGGNLPNIPPDPTKPQEATNRFVSYAILKAEKFHLNSIPKEENLMKEKLTYLFNQSDVEYYAIITKNLPTFVEQAVSATDNPVEYTSPDKIGTWETDALKDLKRLMIFAFLREDEKVLKIMIKSEINKKISQRKKPEENTAPDNKKKSTKK